jgi:hypothetical protein
MDRPRAIAGMGLGSLMELLQGGRDEEHDKIVATVSDITNDRLNELAGGNPLARRYVQNIWRKCMDGLTKNEDIPTDEAVTIAIIRIIADTLEQRNKMHDELHEKRKAEEKAQKAETDKDMH